jgi:hypothetical protein
LRRWISAALAVGTVAVLAPAHASHPAAYAFSPSVRPPCENVTGLNCGRNLEPALAVDPAGNMYLSSILGVPGGVNLWKRPAGQAQFQYLGQPDGIAGVTESAGVAPGGGDVDLAIATAPNGAGKYNLYTASLSAASLTVAVSEDGGATFRQSFVDSAPIFAVDRQWLIADGASDVWLVYRDNKPAMWYIRASHDAAKTWGPPLPLIAPDQVPTAANPVGLPSRAGNLAINRTSKDVYLPYTNAANPQETVLSSQGLSSAVRHVVYLARWHDGMAAGVNSVVYNAPPTERVDAVFPTAAVDSAGNVYVGWSTTKGVYVAVSGDDGATFAPPVKVSQAPVNSTVQPWLAAGNSGRAAIAFLGSSAASNDDNSATWRAYTSFAIDAACQLDVTCGGSGKPAYTQLEASDHVIHTGSVCLRGLNCDTSVPPGDRNLAEVTAIQIDADGLAVVAWPDDSTGPTFSYVAKQIGGPALIGDPSVVLQVKGEDSPGMFAPSGPLTLNFHSSSALATLPDGTDVEGPFISGTLSTASPSDPHVGIVGYATTYTPAVSRPALFESGALGPLGIGGNVVVKLYLQGEAGAAQSAVVDYRLVEVKAGGGIRTLGSRSIVGDASDDCCRYKPGPTAPATITVTFPAITPALLAPGSKLRLELRFTAAVQSGTRFFYDSPLYPASVTVTQGTFS